MPIHKGDWDKGEQPFEDDHDFAVKLLAVVQVPGRAPLPVTLIYPRGIDAEGLRFALQEGIDELEATTS